MSKRPKDPAILSDPAAQAWRRGELAGGKLFTPQPAHREEQTMGNPIPSRDAREGIISVILDAYHTTRMAETPAWMHILSKPFVKSAFDRFEAQIRADANEGLAELLRKCRNVLANSQAESGYCMCGDPIESHNIGSGHAPVDGHIYMAGQLIEEIDTALSTGRQA